MTAATDSGGGSMSGNRETVSDAQTPQAATRRLRVTWVAEYPANPKDYPDCDGDPLKMAALDQRSLNEGDLSPFDLFDSAETTSLEVEVKP